MNKIAQRSIYLTLLHGTMMARSLGKTFQNLPVTERKEKHKQYVKATFKEFDNLCAQVDSGTLRRQDVLNAIERIRKNIRGISFGQSQKGLNVLLKYHCLLFHDYPAILDQLDCPMDKVIQEKRWGKGKNVSLAKMNQADYQQRQAAIPVPRIMYDLGVDKKNMLDWGL